MNDGGLIQVFTRTEVVTLIVRVDDATTEAQRLNKLAPARELSCAITKLDEARLWLKELAEQMGSK